MTADRPAPNDPAPNSARPVDWGSRCERWEGIRSETIDVVGTPVHALVADVGAGGTPQLLVHGLGGSAANWMDVMRPLAEHGPVVAPDLPGFGRTLPPVSRAPRITTNARFLRALLRTLGWERVIIHGSSMGGTLSVLLADLLGERAEALVLASPAMPSAYRAYSMIDRMTLRRFAPFILPQVGALLARRTYGTIPIDKLWDDNLAYVHADPSRISPELRQLGLENFRATIEEPWRLSSFAAAAASLVTAIVTRRMLLSAMSRIAAPTLVLWGDADRLIGRPVVDLLVRRRPDWQLEVLGDVGHAPMIEVPERYVDAFAQWSRARHPLPDQSDKPAP